MASDSQVGPAAVRDGPIYSAARTTFRSISSVGSTGRRQQTKLLWRLTFPRLPRRHGRARSDGVVKGQ
eukprot:2005510-Rhodomonas_salina.1